MKEKTLKFIDELKSWRQENPEKRSFSIIVTDGEDTSVVTAEGNSTALAASALSHAVQSGDAFVLKTIIDTGHKAEFVVNNADDFIKFAQKLHES